MKKQVYIIHQFRFYLLVIGLLLFLLGSLILPLGASQTNASAPLNDSVNNKNVKTELFDWRIAMQAGNDAYAAGKYEEALTHYQRLLKQGFVGGDIPYNLGNIYCQLKQPGQAILWYQRALRAQPNNADIAHNLQFAQTLIEKPIVQLPPPFYSQWSAAVYNLLPADVWAGLALLTIWAALLIVIRNKNNKSRVSIISPKKQQTVLALLVVSVVFLLCTWARYRFEVNHSEAIVMQNNTPLNDNPNPNATPIDTLSAGIKLTVKAQSEGWAQVQLPDLREGWLNTESLTYIW
ncbi:MAG: tetratricopeptide repeat protein [Sphingobacteriales bacterium]|jgi:hypothetical protein|nr:tetratricopeptide repeat protein [Sphingobacteriales bacterium]MBP9142192.1 tetratricopeptide repeat protein [Chitinophagales bacterium]MDA0197751.1 tetratricopeptide repeat protein [Bacteroidota bacterium]MBK6891002.1 tetratricopeptide repeat protein [Sphingobacteriales bacterium]MBK7527168.1 tetratricopeptide repeat protein [Sphingobacteriales bacterium]